MESGVWQERPGWGGKVLSDEMGVGWIHQAVLCKEGRGGDSGDWGRPAFGLRVRGPGRVEPAVRGGSGRGFPLAPPAESGVRDKREGGAQGDVKGAEDQMESFRSIRTDINGPKRMDLDSKVLGC